jgi:hypothetical protein
VGGEEKWEVFHVTDSFLMWRKEMNT